MANQGNINTNLEIYMNKVILGCVILLISMPTFATTKKVIVKKPKDPVVVEIKKPQPPIEKEPTSEFDKIPTRLPGCFFDKAYCASPS